MNLQPVVCKTCQKQAQPGEVIFSSNGLIDQIVGPWYWSENDECWYCRPCERKLTAQLLKQLFQIADKRQIPIVDFDGRPLNQAAAERPKDEPSE